MIVQKNISKIPLKLPYICGTIKEQVKNIYDSKIVDTDLLKIGINNGYQQVISGPMAYISTITVGYVPNKEFIRWARSSERQIIGELERLIDQQSVITVPTLTNYFPI